jgi:hypothetical protein
VSFERPPRCIAMTRESSSPATRVRPPGMTRQPLGVATAKTRSPTVRAANAGALRLEHRCLRHVHPLLGDEVLRPLQDALLQRRRSARPRVSTTIGRSLGERSIGLTMSRSARRHASSKAAGSPSHQVATGGQQQRLAEQLAAEPRQVAEQRARTRAPRAEGVGEQHRAAPGAIGRGRRRRGPSRSAARAGRSSRRPGGARSHARAAGRRSSSARRAVAHGQVAPSTSAKPR